MHNTISASTRARIHHIHIHTHTHIHNKTMSSTQAWCVLAVVKAASKQPRLSDSDFVVVSWRVCCWCLISTWSAMYLCAYTLLYTIAPQVPCVMTICLYLEEVLESCLACSWTSLMCTDSSMDWSCFKLRTSTRCHVQRLHEFFHCMSIMHLYILFLHMDIWSVSYQRICRNVGTHNTHTHRLHVISMSKARPPWAPQE